MEHAITTLALAALALGGRHIWRHFKIRSENKLQRRKLEVWEGEGGAVPLSSPDGRRRTASQISPRPRANASHGPDK
jgi:hypothetical protein